MDKSSTQWALYSDLQPPSICLSRYDDSRNNRFYYYTVPEDGKLVVKTAIGVTSLLGMTMPTSPFLVEWKLTHPDWEQILKSSSDFGTLLHICYAEWLINRSIPEDVVDAARTVAVAAGMGYDAADKGILSFLKWVEDYNVKPILVEAMLLSEPIEGNSYALTLDLLCSIEEDVTHIEISEGEEYKSGERKGQKRVIETKVTERVTRIAIVDFKSNLAEKDSKVFYESHLFQVIAAAKAVHYHYPEISVDYLCNFSALGWRTAPSYNFKIWNPTDTDYKLFDLYVEAGRLRGFFTPSGNKFIAPPFKEGVTSADFQIMSYVEFVENVLLAASIDDAFIDDFADAVDDQ